jgi:hypothetical protein
METSTMTSPETPAGHGSSPTFGNLTLQAYQQELWELGYPGYAAPQQLAGSLLSHSTPRQVYGQQPRPMLSAHRSNELYQLRGAVPNLDLDHVMDYVAPPMNDYETLSMNGYGLQNGNGYQPQQFARRTMGNEQFRHNLEVLAQHQALQYIMMDEPGNHFTDAPFGFGAENLSESDKRKRGNEDDVEGEDEYNRAPKKARR